MRKSLKTSRGIARRRAGTTRTTRLEANGRLTALLNNGFLTTPPQIRRPSTELWLQWDGCATSAALGATARLGKYCADIMPWGLREARQGCGSRSLSSALATLAIAVLITLSWFATLPTITALFLLLALLLLSLAFVLLFLVPVALVVRHQKISSRQEKTAHNA